LNAYVERTDSVAEDDIEKIVRPALEHHSAQEQLEKEDVIQAMDGKTTVEPIWGEPLRRSQFQSDIFMIMPFRERFDAVYEGIIRPMAAELNLTIKCGDDFTSTEGSIIREFWAALNACRLVLVETTEVNANVY